MHYEYRTDPRVCSEAISFDYIDGRLYNIKIRSGCVGSNLGHCKLAEGMYADEVIDRCRGIDCNGIGTSCPDQLAIAVEIFLAQLD